ncbi:MAG: hypothetical protein UT34_C0002G0233 [candidate division WS6 bacterium GW2011_GWF2_39_15]|uniref:GerMN domain-containing protein n=1 Tax=candidate division WS6 bacterium GW2011_GWF2_39_15 TaxID=1619100 RepID=A0A0G0MYV3_9BACT|nr:MAG: hypothetical protein UT34_C0002G0233 [candidate division WS6 bacterium GW2011_GWF2_39_15]
MDSTSTNRNDAQGIINIVLMIIIIGLLGVVAFLLYQSTKYKDIKNYDDCVKAGYPVQESYPSRCTTPDGKSFENPLERKQIDNETPDTEEPNQTTVKIYFSKDPESNDDPTYTVEAKRTTDRKDVGTFALEELIKGPSTAEQSQGIFTQIKLTGESNCGKDFKLVIEDSSDTATVTFCKDLNQPGVMSDSRLLTEVKTTLLQFSTIKKVIVLNKNGDCVGDLSGLNTCLKN